MFHARHAEDVRERPRWRLSAAARARLRRSVVRGRIRLHDPRLGVGSRVSDPRSRPRHFAATDRCGHPRRGHRRAGRERRTGVHVSHPTGLHARRRRLLHHRLLRLRRSLRLPERWVERVGLLLRRRRLQVLDSARLEERRPLVEVVAVTQQDLRAHRPLRSERHERTPA